MKTIIKLTLFAGALALFSGNASYAQAADSGSAIGQGKKCHAMKSLDLTPDQKSKVRQIHHNTKEQAKAIRENSSLDKKQKHEQLKALHAASLQQIKSILTPEQFQKFQEIRAEHKEGQGKQPKVDSSAPTT